MIRLRFDATGPEQVIGGGRATIKVAPPQDDRKGSSLLYYSVAGTTAGSANFLGRPQGIVPTIQRISPLSPWRRSAGLAPVLGWCVWFYHFITPYVCATSSSDLVSSIGLQSPTI